METEFYKSKGLYQISEYFKIVSFKYKLALTLQTLHFVINVIFFLLI